MLQALAALNLSWITARLAVGGRFPGEAVGYLARLGVRAVVDCRAEQQDDPALLAEHGVKLLGLGVLDMMPLSHDQLEAGVAWVRGALAQGERTLIHCEHGIGRSALLGLCVLVDQGDPPLKALRRMKAARSIVCPSPIQLEALIDWLAARRLTHPKSWDVPSLEQLMEIAYRGR